MALRLTFNDSLHVKMMGQSALQTLSQPPFTKVAFKRTLNAYSDNIYYVDRDRANAYLSGGAAPTNTQTIAYLHRNDCLTNIEALVSELEFLIGERDGQRDATDTADLKQFSAAAAAALGKYLSLVPPPEMAAARALVVGKSS